MESIFESLENLNVSEECFNSILSIVEEIISEYDEKDRAEAANKVIPKRQQAFNAACAKLSKIQDKIPLERGLKGKLTSVEKYRSNKAAQEVDRTQSRLNDALDAAGKRRKTPHGIETEK